MEATIRSGVRPLSFLVPALHSSTKRTCLPSRIHASSTFIRAATQVTHRCISSTTHPLQQATAEKPATAEQATDEPSPQHPSNTHTPTTASPKTNSDDSSEKPLTGPSKLLEFATREPTSNPSPRPSRNTPRQPNRPRGPANPARKPPKDSSGSDEATQILQRLGYTSGKPRPGGFDFSRMAEPAPMPGTTPLATTPQRMAPAVLNIPPMELSPSTGRTIRVNPSRKVDLGRAWNLLNIRLAANQVRADWNYQRFHERPGKKRKRLKMVRWRKRFKASFQATVDRVSEMTRRGW